MLKETKRDFSIVFDALQSATARQVAAWQRIRNKMALYETEMMDKEEPKLQLKEV